MRPVARQIFQLKITLDGVTPPVWRRVLVPGGYTLDRVHRVIQYAMGWQNYHLHSFEIDGVQYVVFSVTLKADLSQALPLRLEWYHRTAPLLTGRLDQVVLSIEVPE